MNSQDNSGKYIDFFTVKLLTSDEGLYKSEFVQQNSLHIIGYQQIGICRFINLHICLLHKNGVF